MRRFVTYIMAVALFVGCGGHRKPSPETAEAETQGKPMTLFERIDQMQQQGIELGGWHDGEDSLWIWQRLDSLDRYSRGEIETFPAEVAKSVLNSYAFTLGDCYGHNGYDDEEYKDSLMWGEEGFYRLVEMTVELSPSVEAVAEQCSADKEVGVLNYDEWNSNALYSFVIYHNGESLAAEMVGERGTTYIENIYPLTDTQGRQYYLLSNNLKREEEYSRYMSDPFCQYLYEKSDEGLVLRCHIIGEPFSCSDYQYIIFNPRELRWNHCYKKGDLYYAREGSKTLRLVLDGENSRFTIE